MWVPELADVRCSTPSPKMGFVAWACMTQGKGGGDDNLESTAGALHKELCPSMLTIHTLHEVPV